MPRFRADATTNPRIMALADVFRLSGRDMRTMTDTVDKEFTKNERRLFATEGTSGGSKWPALSPAYAAWKAKKYPGRKIMTRKGKLRKGLGGRNHPDHIATYRLKPSAVITVGTRNPVAAYHIRPGTNQTNPLYNPRLPNRDTLQQTRQQEARYHDLIQSYLVDVKLDRVRRILSAWPG